MFVVGFLKLTTLSENEAIIGFPTGGSRCKICDKIFKGYKAGLKHYELVHTYQPQVQCAICHKVLSSKFSFRTHLNLKHKIMGKDLVRCYGNVIN